MRWKGKYTWFSGTFVIIFMTHIHEDLSSVLLLPHLSTWNLHSIYVAYLCGMFHFCIDSCMTKILILTWTHCVITVFISVVCIKILESKLYDWHILIICHSKSNHKLQQHWGLMQWRHVLAMKTFCELAYFCWCDFNKLNFPQQCTCCSTIFESVHAKFSVMCRTWELEWQQAVGHAMWVTLIMTLT